MELMDEESDEEMWSDSSGLASEIDVDDGEHLSEMDYDSGSTASIGSSLSEDFRSAYEEADSAAPIYDGARLSRRQAHYLVLNTLLALGVSDNKYAILLKCINMFCPNNVFGSSEQFLDYFKIANSQLVFVCTKDSCHGVVEDQDTLFQCTNCHSPYSRSELTSKRSYFKYQPLKPQLLDIIENKDLLNAMTAHKLNDTLNSVVQSSHYKGLVAADIIRKNDITLQINTDGVSATKSSKLSFWPAFISINELPLRLRTENMMLVAIWMGKKKPHMNTFLGPLINELKDLHKNGILTSQGQIRVHCLLSPVDSPAKADLMCHSYPGGKYACTWCYQKAVTVKKGKGTTRIYRIIKPGKARDKWNYLKFNQRRFKKRQTHYRGVKGVSALASLQPFDVVNGFVVDYLHAFCVGVFNHFLEYLTGAEHAQELFSIRRSLGVADQLLTSVTPPSELKRLPEPLSQYKNMKASLKKDLFLYFLLPILAALQFPQEYLNHALLLVVSFRKYLQSKLSEEEKMKARLALIKFLDQLPKLYSELLLIYNTHILTHVPDICERWGGLWDANTFNYEGKNGMLAKLHHGTLYQPDQILKNYLRLKACQNSEFRSKEYDEGDFKNLYLELLQRKKQCKIARRIKNCILFGKGHVLSESSEIFQEVSNSLEGRPFQLLRYKRFMINKIVACTVEYSRLVKRRDCVFSTNDNKIVKLQSLVATKEENGKEEVFILVHELRKKNVALASDPDLQITSTDFLQETEEIHENIIMKIEELKAKQVCFDIQGKTYVTDLVNVLEGD